MPGEIGFATKPELALDMITAALDAGVPAGWAAADEAYGNNAASVPVYANSGSATSSRCPAAT